jgi:exodeoxyribonuclease V beta subunit
MKVKNFNVLDPDLDLFQKFFIEASAGCGKTFSIEHALIRLLLDREKGLSLNEILVLTFTKESTKDLKMRIRTGIEKTIFQLENFSETSTPYLNEILKSGEGDKASALRVLLDALSNFDQAQIFTLHSFCFRMLKEHLFDAQLNIQDNFQDEGPSLSFIKDTIHDFLSFDLDSLVFSSSQIRILFQYFRNDFDTFLSACTHQLSKEIKALSFETYSERSQVLFKEIEFLNQREQWASLEIKENCLAQSLFYKGGHNRSGQIYPELQRAIERFSHLFHNSTLAVLNDFLWDASLFFEHFNPNNLKKGKNVEKQITSSPFFQLIHTHLYPIIHEMSSPEHIFSRLISYMQKLYDSRLSLNKALTPNKLLLDLKKLSKQPEVSKKIAQRYQAVIVDEFQDTDPIQWEILSNIFLKNRGENFPFYLVGDPKQSIYAFRQADIYTYLKASKDLGQEQRMVLNTNYRSQPELISGLNDLFQKFTSEWIDLPKWNQTLSCLAVQSCPEISIRNYQDNRQAIHFFSCEEEGRREAVPSKKTEEERLFPFILNEILRLNQQQNVPFSSFALLVRDRFQGDRLKKFLKSHQIPYKSTRPEPLNCSEVAYEFLQLFKAILDSKNIPLLQILELNSIFSLPLPRESRVESLSKVMSYFAELKELLLSEGFLPFYNKLMNEPLLEQKPFNEHILNLEEGLNYYLELDQIKDLLVELEISGKSPEEFISFLETLSREAFPMEAPIMQRQTLELDAVHILSLHLSKGLEFEIVFALGLANRTLQREALIPTENKDETLLIPSTFSNVLTESYDKERASEKLRQLYVALTRAKQRLYIPLVFAQETELKKSSPLEIFLKRIQLENADFIEFIKSHPHMSLTQIEGQIEIQTYSSKKEVTLITPNLIELVLPKCKLHSFSTLTRKRDSSLFDLGAPHHFDEIEKTIHTLPAGAETGTLYHLILEKINFDTKDFSSAPFLENTPYAAWEDVFDENIRAILEMEIVTPKGSFSLNKLSTKSVLKEVEFLYPIESVKPIEGLAKKGDLLQGVIDLVCEVHGEYFIIDYKTNWLGPNQQAYQNLEEVMHRHQYFLQGSIYKRALENYLNIFGRSLKNKIGGVIYLFVRGMNYYSF